MVLLKRRGRPAEPVLAEAFGLEGGEVGGYLGRITPVAAAQPTDAAPLPERIVALRERVAGRYGMEWLSGETPLMRRLAEQVRLAADLSTPAALVGEEGSGKESVARVLHYQGRRRDWKRI